MKKAFFYIVTTAVLTLATTSCSGNKIVTGGVTGGDQVEALAKQAAEQIARCDRSDTLAIQAAIMEARAQRSALALAGHEDDAEDFDEALHDRLMELDAQLCNTIFATK
ncbi:MAG: hypothetical protein MJZ74_08740 [Muribaculaceae bacterium]|nr:hypothetical protein [Muribaculaceae bacterium]